MIWYQVVVRAKIRIITSCILGSILHIVDSEI